MTIGRVLLPIVGSVFLASNAIAQPPILLRGLRNVISRRFQKRKNQGLTLFLI
jgi:hypothetical protein